MFDTEIVSNDDWEKQLDKDSLIEKHNAKVWNTLTSAKEYDRY